jgi:hypothetical protein
VSGLLFPDGWDPVLPHGMAHGGVLALDYSVGLDEDTGALVALASEGQYVFEPSGDGTSFVEHFEREAVEAGLDPQGDTLRLLLQDLLVVAPPPGPQTLGDLLAALPERLGRTAAELLAEVPEDTDWIVPGVLVPGWATKLAGREKSGKGTKAYYWLSRVERGEPTVFGASKRATALILTEEPMEAVREKVEAFGLEHARIVYGWELASLPWARKVKRLVEAAVEDGHEIVFVDNVSRSAGVEEEGGVELARAVELLQDACRAAGLALLLDHHHKKGRGAIEDKSRGGTGLAGAMDVNVELERVGGLASRRRRLTARGRLRATNWQRVFELTDDGRDYVEVEDTGEASDDREEETRMVDSMLLAQLGAEGATAEGFASIIGMGERTARRRLKALVDAGLASMSPGVKQPDGKYAPSIWVTRSRQEPSSEEPRT